MTISSDTLRALRVFDQPTIPFDPDLAPPDPTELFSAWLALAITAKCVEPHVMTLSTCDEDGTPDARALILKDFGDDTWWFASSSSSVKGRQLSTRPAAALTFYWPQLSRQVRIRGPVITAPGHDSHRDFAARSAQARATALASRQSEVLPSREACSQAVDTAVEHVDQPPVDGRLDWTLYGVRATHVEFWQASADRQHIRLRYRQDDGWVRELLWP